MGKSFVAPPPISKASSPVLAATTTSDGAEPVRRQTASEIKLLAYRFPRKYSPMQLLVLAKKFDATDAC